MQHSDNYFSLWLRSLAQPVTYLGAAMLVFIYCTLTYLLVNDRQVAEYDAGRRVDSLAHVVDKSFSHIFNSIDSTLLFLRKSYESNPTAFDFAAWAGDPSIRNELIFDIGLIDANGRIVNSSISNNIIGVDRSDRDYFRAHATSAVDELLISKPAILATNGKWTIMLTRRISASDGTFAGVIGALIDPRELVKHIGEIDLGPDGSVALVGLDSVLRTRSVNGTVDWKSIGEKVRLIPETLGRAFKEKSGHYWSIPGVFNNVRRLISYRVLESVPMISLVSISEAEVYQRANENARVYWGIALALTAAIAIAVGFGAWRERKLVETTSEMQQVQDALARSQERYTLVERAVNDGLWDWNIATGEAYLSPRWKSILGYADDELPNVASSFSDRIHPDEKAAAIVAVQAHLEENEPYAVDFRLRCKNGDYRWVHCRGKAVRDDVGRPVRMLGTITDVSDRKQAEAQISYIARHDLLTGIANRAVLHEKLEEVLARLRRHQEAFAVLMFDLDGFKHINDTLGHAAGDKLLKKLAQRLTFSLRETDVLARLGGDEFAIIQSGETNQREAAIALAVRVLEIVAEPFDLDGHKVTVGTSIGITLAPEDGSDAGELLQKADLALYRVKSEGRNNFRFFEAEMSKDASERLQLLSDMRRALIRREFELYYQPVFDAKTHRPCCAEALVRWRHPVNGLMPPDRFIPLAEETGLMEPLGEWILEQACKDAASWPDDIKLAVNLSAVQFRSGKLFDVILCALVESGLPPARLELEITESVLMQNAESNSAVIRQLKNLGISIALDDFGTGYSSLSYLTTFPFDKIKIDKSFTQGLSIRADCAAVVASVLTLARGLDMTVTAEGVETKQQFELLRAAGVHQMQGYLFARPGPLAELNFSALEQTGQAVAAA